MGRNPHLDSPVSQRPWLTAPQELAGDQNCL